MLMISTGGKDIGLSTAFYTFLKEMLIGGILGVVIGKLLVLVMNKAHLTYESLYPGLALSIILFSYSFANYLNGSGFLAVYIAGLVLGRHDFLHKKSLIKFYDGVTWLMQVIMFVVLGLLVYPKRLIPIAGSGILISMVLMFIARPLGVFLSLAFFKSINIRQKLFISWGGLRGAAPVVFAIYPLISGFEKADVIFHLIFFIVITSVLLQGTTLYPLAKVLDLEDLTYLHHPNSTSSINDIKSYSSNELIEIVINVDSPIVGNKIVDLGFPQNSMIILIYRDGVYITPHGGTILEAMDRLTIISPDKVELQLVEKCLCVSSINIMSQHS